jgi:DNA polymerase-3 subunit alpha
MSLFSLIEPAEKQEPKPPTVTKPTTKLQQLLKEKQLLGFFITGHPLDAYRPLLDRLSAVSLSQIGAFSGDTVLRLSFIVEEIQVRIASKSQKKFAILTISDGFERMEAVIWSDLYEEKKGLLAENQLLYAVVQVEKKEETLKMTIRWLDDLTRADEKMIFACDQAYDRAKFQLNRAQMFQNPKKGKEMPQKPPAAAAKPKESAVQKWVVQVDIDKMQLSQILKLKGLVSQMPGALPLEFHFLSQGIEVASILASPSFGIAGQEEMQRHIQSVPGIIAIKAH